MANKPATFSPGGKSARERKRENAKHVDQKREREKPYRAWYRTARWAEVRRIVIARDTYCQMCIARDILQGIDVVDHKKPHKGNVVLFWTLSNLWGLCTTCHSSAKQREESRGEQ